MSTSRGSGNKVLSLKDFLMIERIDNRNVIDIGPLITPRKVKEILPLTDSAESIVVKTRQSIQDILHGRDARRLLVVVGPCSIHDADAAYAYAERLKKVADATQDQLVIVMRTYFEKPRTTVGWKGLINDPMLDGSCDIAKGFQLARTILLSINNMGMPCGSEFLDPVTPQYISDLISWAAIGARTTESQTHREMASGLSMPVGFKNGTDGSLQIALNAMIAASQPHNFVGINVDGITSIIKTNGNPDRHVVLRGGGGQANYSPDHIARAVKGLAQEVTSRLIMVDCSHGNSEKDHTRQANVARSVLEQVKEGQESIMGLLMESHLNPGNQSWEKGKSLDYGVSITDACLGWDETETLLYEMASQLTQPTKANAF
jgi:3-deoxy-7-phosphoheptulonate synthase